MGPRSGATYTASGMQTLGIIGWGRIGRAVSAKAMALGFKVMANDPYVDRKQMLDAGVQPSDKETLLRNLIM